ncbi:hypothetical protein [Amycolatopsis benzoatilytica]|uniref:hypothetical protein n=1 Tax=Amycolatopsis benzoatilytica TaxID=346045 RepID=UPI0003A1EF26|nr:hypothetical protein [Amycolatopsis benzoatilytica]
MALSGSGRVKVDFVERLTRPVQEVLPAQFLALPGGVRIAVPDGAIELDRRRSNSICRPGLGG